MIEPLYRKNNDIDKDNSIVTSYYRYKAISQFLYNIEILAPEVIEDLKDIMPSYINTLKKLKELKKNNEYISEWSITEYQSLKALSLAYEESEFADLINKIEEWALKYNLMDDNCLYINIALLAMFEKIYIRNRTIGMELLFGVDDIPQEIIKKRNDKNYISLSAGIVHGIGFEDEELSKITNHNRNHYELKWDFPFVFAPSAEYHIYGGSEEDILDNWEKPETYETPYIYDYMKSILLNTNKNKSSTETKTHAFFYQDPWNESLNPIAWDPRETTWNDFEKLIDELYKHYKEAYRKRTEEFFKQNGYVKGKEKYEDSHFEWFVRYQVQGWSKEKIAREYHVTRQSVTNAIEGIGDLVGLKPRPTSKGGRPKKG